MSDNEMQRAVGLRQRLAGDLELLTYSLQEVGSVPWLTNGAVQAQITLAAQSLYTAISRLESTSRRRFGKDTWEQALKDAQPVGDPE